MLGALRSKMALPCTGLAAGLPLPWPPPPLAAAAPRWRSRREEAAEMTGVETMSASSPGCGPCSKSIDTVRRCRGMLQGRAVGAAVGSEERRGSRARKCSGGRRVAGYR